jgi:hypothetical protein
MASKILFVALLFLCPLTSAAQAAERIYCASSDKTVDMSLESGFSSKDQEKLVHFRGMAGVKDAAAPREFRRFQINSEMLRQYWIDDSDLRFSIQTFTPPSQPVYRVTMSMRTARSSQTATRFDGRYELKVEKLKMGSTVGADILVSHTSAIFCDIKAR